MSKKREAVIENGQTVQNGVAQDAGAGVPAQSALSPAQAAPAPADGLPIPHKRAVWNQAEVIKFVECWNASNSIQEVVKKMNRSLAACYSMAKQARKNGVLLKSLGKTAGIDWSSVKTQLSTEPIK